MQNIKRLGIFVFYDNSGYAGRYVDYLLEDMSENLTDLVIVCNGKLLPDSRMRFEAYTSFIYIRENKGFDGAAWKDAIINYIGFEKISNYDELVCFNDICYGPLYPMSVVFETMQKRDDIDFWGLTRHYKAKDFTGHYESGILPEHIQTYFFVVKKRMLNSPNFKKFWYEMPEIVKFSDDIGAFETRFTDYFENCGFRWDTYVNMESLKGKELDNFCCNYDLPFVLVSELNHPMVRRKSLTQFVENSHSGPEKDPRRVIEYIEQNTNYDISLIWEDLLRKNNIADIYTRLHLDYILPKNGVIFKPEKENRIALLMHIYYKDQIEYCFNFAQSMPPYADIYVTTIAENKEEVDKVFASITCNKFESRIVKNRGRDMSALFVGCADILHDGGYDYICAIHDKKSPQTGILSGMAFRDLTFENTLASKDFVENIIGLFDKEPYLGYLGFPYMIGGPYWPVLTNAWASNSNFHMTKKILEKCRANVNISMNKPPILYANVFWCRPHALKPLADLQLKYEDFDPEPLAIDGTFSHALERTVTYVSQSQGYYSGVLFSDEYASIYIPALMREYTRMSFTHFNFLTQLKTNPQYILSITDISALPVRTLLKNIGKKFLHPFPFLYKITAKIWRKIRT